MHTIPHSKFEKDEYTKEAFAEFQKWLKSEHLVCKFVVEDGYYYERDDKVTTTEVYLVVSVKE